MNRSTVIVLTVVLAVGGAFAHAGGDPKKEEAVQKELKMLEGTWEVLRIELNGVKGSYPEGKSPQRFVFERDTYAMENMRKVTGKGAVKVDPDKMPRTLDLLPEEGQGKGKTARAIYELKDGELTLCMAPFDAQRPMAFAADRGSKNALLICRRVRTKE
jgi:uncharacterized protein (TIGR03067 family)